LFRPDWRQPQVSIMDTIAERHPMDVGDPIRFNIQGVSLEARIASIRTRENASLSPFLYFVFQEKTLKDAPQTLFAALRVPTKRIGTLQTQVVNRFSNIGAINVSATVLAGMQMLPNLGPEFVQAFGRIYPIPFFLQGVAGNSELNQSDRIHPTAEGYARIVDHIYPYVIQAIERRSGRSGQ
jgi:hypothetical protein